MRVQCSRIAPISRLDTSGDCPCIARRMCRSWWTPSRPARWPKRCFMRREQAAWYDGEDARLARALFSEVSHFARMAPQTAIPVELAPASGSHEHHAIAVPQPGATARLISDLRELFKGRVTGMVVVTGWAGFYLGSMQSGIS